MYLEHLECSLQPESSGAPGCFTKKCKINVKTTIPYAYRSDYGKRYPVPVTDHAPPPPPRPHHHHRYTGTLIARGTLCMPVYPASMCPS